jgi:hypothetical protein
MQPGEKDGSLHRELERAVGEELLDDGSTARLLPQSLEQQGRADVPGGDDRQPALQQGVQWTVLLESIQAAQGDNNLLARLAVFSAVVDDLEVGAAAGLHGAEQHGASG